jgi:hypothetical protein
MSEENKEFRGPTLEEQAYLQKILGLFNVSPENPELTAIEKAVLMKIMTVEKETSEIIKQAMEINKEIEEKQNKITMLNQQILHKKGQARGLCDSLLATRKQ